jgi:chemotaxis protein histidine kinase CheA
LCTNFYHYYNNPTTQNIGRAMPFKPGQAGAASAAKIASDAHPKRAAASAASVAMSPQKRIRRQRVSVRKATTEPARAEAAFDRKHPRQDELTKKEKTRLKVSAWRKGRTSKQKNKTKVCDRSRKRDAVGKMTPKEQEKHRSDKRASTATWRKNLSKEKKAKIAAQDSEQHRKKRAANPEQGKLEEKKKKQVDEEDNKWREIMNTAEEHFLKRERHPLFDYLQNLPLCLAEKNHKRASKREAEDSDYEFDWTDEVDGRFDLNLQLLDNRATYMEDLHTICKSCSRCNVHATQYTSWKGKPHYRNWSDVQWEKRERKPNLPKDANYKLCNPVEVMGITYSYQCVFCNDLFLQYPCHHMVQCSHWVSWWAEGDPWEGKPLPLKFRKLPFYMYREEYYGRDATTTQKNLDILKHDVEDYGTRVCDTSNDWKVRILPIDSNYALCRPVYYEGEIYNFQCWFCNKLFKSFNDMVRNHMGVCSEGQYAPAIMMELFISLYWYIEFRNGGGRYATSYHGLRLNCGERWLRPWTPSWHR